MFKQQDEQVERVDTIIGPSVSVEGNFRGEGNIIVEGEVKGNMKTKGFIKASESSNIIANINAGSAEISGQVTGNIKVKDSLEIKESAGIQGDIEAGTISVAYGAIINGNIKMKNERVADNTVLEEGGKEEK